MGEMMASVAHGMESHNLAEKGLFRRCLVSEFDTPVRITLLRQNAPWLATGMNGEESPPKL
jgi:hypothetical protein